MTCSCSRIILQTRGSSNSNFWRQLFSRLFFAHNPGGYTNLFMKGKTWASYAKRSTQRRKWVMENFEKRKEKKTVERTKRCFTCLVLFSRDVTQTKGQSKGKRRVRFSFCIWIQTFWFVKNNKPEWMCRISRVNGQNWKENKEGRR